MSVCVKLLCTLVESLTYSERAHFKVAPDDEPDSPTITGKLTLDVSSTNTDAPTFERDRTYFAQIVALD